MVGHNPSPFFSNWGGTKWSMFYVYVLKSKKDGKFYIGFTPNLRLRFQEHNDGEVKSTIYRRPLELIYKG